MFESGYDGAGSGLFERTFSQALDLGFAVARQRLNTGPSAYQVDPKFAGSVGNNGQGQAGQPKPLFTVGQQITVDPATKNLLIWAGVGIVAIVVLTKFVK